MSKLKFIYFDVGGVLIQDFSGREGVWEELFTNLGIKEEKWGKFKEFLFSNEHRAAKGLEVSKLINEAEEELGVRISDDVDVISEFVSLFERNESIWRVVEQAKASSKIGMLTAQFVGMLDQIIAAGLIPEEIDWDTIVDSSVVGFTKPETQIYEIAEQQAGVEPESILFIDNKPELLEIPNQRGWKTFRYDPAEMEESTKELEVYFAKINNG
ncbi:MAG: HAD family hydrolase [Candidatus Dojkabacteria bacterium]